MKVIDLPCGTRLTFWGDGDLEIEQLDPLDNTHVDSVWITGKSVGVATRWLAARLIERTEERRGGKQIANQDG